MHWNTLALEMKTEILLYVFDARSIGSLYLSFRQNKLALVCKEWREIIKSKYFNRLLSAALPFEFNGTCPFAIIHQESNTIRCWKRYRLTETFDHKIPNLLDNSGNQLRMDGAFVTCEEYFAIQTNNTVSIYHKYPQANADYTITLPSTNIILSNIIDTVIGIVIIYHYNGRFRYMASVRDKYYYPCPWDSKHICGYYGMYYLYAYRNNEMMFVPWKDIKREMPVRTLVNFPREIEYLQCYSFGRGIYLDCFWNKDTVFGYNPIEDRIIWSIKGGGKITINHCSNGLLYGVRGGMETVVIDALTGVIVFRASKETNIYGLTLKDDGAGYYLWLLAT